MDNSHKTKEELDIELRALQQAYHSLKATIETDLVSHKHTLDELRESEERFIKLSSFTNEGILVHNKGVALDVNQCMVKVLGYQREEIIGMNLFNLIHPDYHQIVKKNLQKRVTSPYQIVAIRKDGSTFYAEIEARDISYNGEYFRIASVRDITQRKQAERELQLANDVLSNVQLGVYVYHLENIDDDRTLRMISANPATEAFTGIKVSDIIGKTLDENFPGLRDLGYPQRYAQVVRSGKAQIFEDMAYSDNRIVQSCFSVKAFPLPDNHLGIAFENITEKVQALNLIAESNTRLKIAQEVGNVGSWEHDLITNKVTWSDHTYTIYEEDPDSFEVSFENVVNHFPKEDRESVIEAVKRSISEKIDIHIEHKIITGKGNMRYVLESGRVILSADGKPIKLVGSVADITERKTIENSLRKSRDLFRQISRMTKAGGWNVDLITGEHNWTDLTREIHEVGPDFIPDMDCAINFYKEGESRDTITKCVNRCLETGEPFDADVQIITAKGNTRWVRAMGSAEFQNGKCVRLNGTFQDITQAKETNLELIAAKEQAQESDRLKSAFLANMSHEIRTPMNGILGFTDLLKESNLTGDELQEYIQIIEKSGKRMLNIINDIVDMSKIESGLMKIEIQDCNINEQIDYIYTFFKPEVEAKGLKLSFNSQLPTQEANLKIDREKNYAILTNLVKNSIKYTNEGSIDFGYSIRENYLEFYVKDTGIGIPKNRHDAIFKRFIQAGVEYKTAQQGAGLGLAITKSYVEMLGGKIWVESQEGLGSTFYYTLPYTI
jgi:PAS domain S-box-containing protein